MAVVLVVEDAQELARLIRRELEAAGHRVVTAGDGEEALRLHALERPDAVVLDWMLPKLDGLEVLRRVREEAATPVLMLTARGEEVDLVMGLEVGADDYLAKPFSTRELLARVRPCSGGKSSSGRRSKPTAAGRMPWDASATGRCSSSIRWTTARPSKAKRSG